MNKETLRKADFKTGILLIGFCLWFLSITFLFMPFKETYGGVENVWYVSPWIFPAVVLTLLLILAVILTVNAIKQNGFRDLVVFPLGRLSGFRLTTSGIAAVALLCLACGIGIWYLVVNIQKKIDSGLEEAKWLADPSSVVVFQWSDPFAVFPLGLLSMLMLASATVLAMGLQRRQQEDSVTRGGWSEASVSFTIISLLFIVLVYVFVPRLDFFVAILLFLTVFTVSFHVGDVDIIRLSMGCYLVIAAACLLVFATSLDHRMNAVYVYFTDFAVLGLTIVYMLAAGIMLRNDAEAFGRYRTCLIVSWLTPLLVVPMFRFGLLVPLPHEGGVIELMQQLRYLAR